jgi:coenzyme PQQ synthesis protein D (PqqD)
MAAANLLVFAARVQALPIAANLSAPGPHMSSETTASTFATPMIGSLAPSARASVIVSATPDGSVLLSTETEEYFGLNRTGTFIWNHLHPTCDTIDQICVALAAAFPSGEPERIDRDVRRLLARLVEKQLIDPRVASS